MEIKFTIPKNLVKEHGKGRCNMMKDYLEKKMESEFQHHMIEWEQESKKRNMIAKSESICIQPIDYITYIGNYYDGDYKSINEIPKANTYRFETIKAIVREKHNKLHCPMNLKKHWDIKNRAMRKAYAEIAIEIERIERWK